MMHGAEEFSTDRVYATDILAELSDQDLETRRRGLAALLVKFGNEAEAEQPKIEFLRQLHISVLAEIERHSQIALQAS